MNHSISGGTKATRRLLRAVVMALAITMVFAVSPPASTDEAWEAVPGGWVSGSISYVSTIPFDAGGGVGAALHGKHMYVTTFRGFSIYDVSDPRSPQLVSTTALGPHVFNEQPQTNGKILLLTKDMPNPVLQVWDVRDKVSPVKLIDFALPKADHIWSCMTNCRFAFGGRGTIVDLRKPSSPKIVGDWAEGLSIERFHAINEVAPGRFLTGSRPVYQLDARANPKKPKVVMSQPLEPSPAPGLISPANPPPAWLDWPLKARDRFALVSHETPFSGPCNKNSGGFYTYDTRAWKKFKSFKLIDTFKIDTPEGIYTEGRAPYTVFGCTSYAFDTPPNYGRSRRAAVAWFENGLRLLDIDDKGKISEAGGFVPLGGSSSAPVWVNAKTLYVVDLNRGIDILEVD